MTDAWQTPPPGHTVNTVSVPTVALASGEEEARMERQEEQCLVGNDVNLEHSRNGFLNKEGEGERGLG